MKKFLSILLVLIVSVGLFASGQKEADTSTVAAPTWEQGGTPLSDLKIRQALRYAIDMDTIIDTLFEGKAEIAKSLIGNGPYLAEDLKTYDYNPEKAKSLLIEAGWPSDYTLDVVYYYSDQQTVDFMSIIQQYWKAVGVKSSFRKLEGDLGAQLWVAPADRKNGPSVVKWDMAYAGIAALTNNEFFDRFESIASNNSTLPFSEGLDELLQATRATTDVAAQQAAFKDVERKVADNMYNMPLYHQLSFIYTSDKIDMHGAKLGNDQFSFDKEILDWTTTRSDKTLYTNGGPMEFYQAPTVNPGYFLYQELIFDRLIDADGSLTPTEGQLAKDYTLSEDGMEIKFNLRDNVKWHDGASFTAEDVKFSIEYLIKVPGLNAVAQSTYKAIEGSAAYLDGSANDISGIKINGDTVTITFSILDPNALLTFSQWPVLPEHLLKNSNPIKAQQNEFWQNPVGTGPYKVLNTVLNNYGILERNNDYFKTGTGNIEKVYMTANNENDANLIKNAEAGKIDYAFSKNVNDNKGISKISGMTIHPISIRYTRLFYINQYPHAANID
jgi:peptide/nickel transport system substrate-binding protein